MGTCADDKSVLLAFRRAGGAQVRITPEPGNPYGLDKSGTFEDPDGWRVVSAVSIAMMGPCPVAPDF
jgi:YycE-like protein